EIWVQFSPTLEQVYGGTIAIGGGGAPGIEVAVSGTGINTPATVTTGGTLSVAQDQAEVEGGIGDAGCTALTAYGIEYSTTEDFTPGTGVQEASTNLFNGAFSSALGGLIPCTIYYYVAYATNAGGTVYGEQVSFETDAISAPVATIPGTVGVSDFTATWEAVAGASGYRLDVSTSPTFGSIILGSDLFFSEYVEGSGNNKYVEIYNGTGTSVD